MIIPQIVLNIHDIGTILGETTNKTIIIMYDVVTGGVK